MTPIIVPDDVVAADTLEQLVIDGLELNSEDGTYFLTAVAFPPPEERVEWATSVDSDGGVLVRDPLYENRVITATVEVWAGSRDLAHSLIGAIVDKFQECKQQPDGLPLVWTPKNSTKSLTFYCLDAAITEIPIDSASPYFNAAPVVTVNLSMTCKPFGYGPEVLLGTATAATPAITVALPDVPGDVPAEGRLVVTDAATQVRRDVIWGLEQRHYNGASVLLTSSDLTTSGFSGALTAYAGVYSSGGVIQQALQPFETAMAGSGSLAHVGAYRVFARVVQNYTDELRLAYRSGDGDYVSNDWAQATFSGMAEMDLGPVLIPEASAGTQSWDFLLEARGDTGNTFRVDFVLLVPLEAYGRAQASTAQRAGVVAAADYFTGTTVGDPLNARVLPTGQTWATNGGAGDFLATEFVTSDASAECLVRAATTGARYATVGTAVGAQQVDMVISANATTNSVYLAALARYVDTSNHLYFGVTWTGGATAQAEVMEKIAGVWNTLASHPVPFQGWPAWYRLSLTAYPSGAASGLITTLAGQVLWGFQTWSAQLAAGGVLATGKPGMFDDGFAATNRYYDSFAYSVPAAEPYVIGATRSLEVRPEGAIRQTAGTSYGTPSYRGAGFFVPPAGDAGRTSRVVVRPARLNLGEHGGYYGNATDSTTVGVYGTPRWLVVPR